MLYKKLGTEAIERNWEYDCIIDYYKIPSTLIIPKSVWYIGRRAFWGCKKLREVIIPNNVDVIGYHAFEWCENLKKVIIPNCVWKIDHGAFYECRDTEIILKKTKSKFRIGINAFYNCKSVVEDVKEKTRNRGDREKLGL